MKKPTRLKFQKNKYGYIFLLLFIVAELVFTVVGLEKYTVKAFVGVDTFINIFMILIGFLTAIKLRVYEKKWAIFAFVLAGLQLLRLFTIQSIDSAFNQRVLVISLILSAIFATAGGLITLKLAKIKEAVLAGKIFDEIDEVVIEEELEDEVDLSEFVDLENLEQTEEQEVDFELIDDEDFFDESIVMQLKGINKVYPNGVQAVYDFNLDIHKNDFVVLVGPSGCGKSTTLRMVAGLEKITSGELLVGNNVMNNVAPADRDVAMIFQDYALYGHMTVYENIGFSLEVRKENKNSIHEKVMKSSEVVQLNNELNRLPAHLSGGQRQRVALGRSIVRDAKIFLMDEPLSNLDAKLRDETRKEIVKLHKNLDATIIYVTHDQIEAMVMATKIVIMEDGFVQQIGEPLEVYNKPLNLFVASFIGTLPMNFFDATVINNKINFVDKEFNLNDKQKQFFKAHSNKELVVGIRPEDLVIANSKTVTDSDWLIEVDVINVEFNGAHTTIRFNLDGTEFGNMAKIDAENNIKVGDKIILKVIQDKVNYFDKTTTYRITDNLNNIEGIISGNKFIIDEEKYINISVDNMIKHKLVEGKMYNLQFNNEAVFLNNESNFNVIAKKVSQTKSSSFIEFEHLGQTFKAVIQKDEIILVNNLYNVDINLDFTKFTEL